MLSALDADTMRPSASGSRPLHGHGLGAKSTLSTVELLVLWYFITATGQETDRRN